MTIGELIRLLSKFPKSAQIYHDGLYLSEINMYEDSDGDIVVTDVAYVNEIKNGEETK